MKLLHISDLHLDWVTYGVRRFEEIRDAFREAVEMACKECDAFVFTGDLCDPDLTVPIVSSCIEEAVWGARRCNDAGIPNLWISGNHDVIEDGRGRTTLAPLASLGKYTTLFETAALMSVPIGLERTFCDVLALPYPHVTTPYTFDDAFGFLGNKETLAPLIILVHLSIPGVIPGEESQEMARGRDVNFPFDRVTKVLKGRSGVVLAGHYHRQQSLKIDDEHWLHIAGSVARLTFSEEHHTPGFSIVEL